MSATAFTSVIGGNGRLGGRIYTAASAPTADNDTVNGYFAGDVFIVGTTIYQAVSVAEGAAVWINHGTVATPIADPGNGNAIPVTHSGHCPIVTAGVETRTLAIPTFVGQEILLFIKTDGGSCVLTVASAINQTGNNTVTINDVNDSIRLHAISINGTLAWRVVCNDGAALSTV